MKRFLFLVVILALLLSACSGPIGQSSPSISGGDGASGTTIEGAGQAADYSGLMDLIRKAQANSTLYGDRRYLSGAKNATVEAAADTDESQSASGNDYSKTNIQVEGVDEADIIKTDGRYLYLVANNRLIIVDAADPANMQVVSTQKFSYGDQTAKVVTSESPVELYLDVENQRLVLIVTGNVSTMIEPEPTETGAETDPVEPTSTETGDETDPVETTPTETGAETDPADTITSETAPAETGSGAGSSGNTGSGQTVALAPDEVKATIDTDDTADSEIAVDRIGYPYYQSTQYTTVRIYNIQDKSAPVITRQFTQEGYYLTSRKIDGSLYIVTNQYQYLVYDTTAKDLEPGDIFPAVCVDAASDEWTTIPADKISILPEGDISNQLILSAIDTLQDQSEADTIAVIGSSGTVYASAGFLYVAAWNYQWDGKETSSPVYSTDIYRFKLAGSTISAAGKGSVPGSIVNQFSMDEYNGYFRIATTTGDNWSGDEANSSKNNLYILDGSLNITGQVTGLAPAETIQSVRFMGDQAYIVTFRTVDPLFVIDLSNPSAPVVRGQLKIPGYSTYLHPYDDNLLLGFGYDVKTEGESAYNMGLKVSLFDISDFDNPREVSTLLLGGRGSYAEVLYNHKTLLFSKEKNLIAFPATLTAQSIKDPLEYTEPVFQGLVILSIDADLQIARRGQITHFDKLSDPDGQPQKLTDLEYNAFYGYDAVTRAAYIGDILYTFSARQVRAARLSDLGAVGQVELPGYDEATGYWGIAYSRGVLVD